METLTAQSPAAVVTQGPTTASIAEFRAAKGFTSAFQYIRTNASGYPYITFINASNEAENVYFSKQASDKVLGLVEAAKQAGRTYQRKNADDTVDQLPAVGLAEVGLKDMVMVLATYTDGRPDQWKIATGNSLRLDDAGLAALGI